MTDEGLWVSHAVDAYTAGQPLALIIGHDDTLAPIRTNPDLAAVSPVTRGHLAELAALDRVTVGVVSDRPLADLRRRVGLPGVLYAGCGGMFIDLGRQVLADPAAAEFDPLADSLVVALAAVVNWFPGTWIERKPGCLAVHYRRLTPLKAACFRDEVRDVFATLADDAPPFRVRDTTRSFEIALASAWTKGQAVARMVAAAGPGACPVYVGDGANDRETVAWVNACGGVTVAVGPDSASGVRYHADSPEEFAAGLAEVLAALTGTDTPAYAGRVGG